MGTGSDVCVKCGGSDWSPIKRCRICAHAYYLSNPEKSKKAKDQNRARRLRDPEKAKEYQAAYYVANSGKAKRRASDWYYADPDRARKSALLRKGVTPELYDALLEKQGGKCAICGTDKPGHGNRFFSIDHDHNCCPDRKACKLCVRGLLCSPCNIAIGGLQDSEDVVLKAYEYLKFWNNIK
jgi:hypothetical protein